MLESNIIEYKRDIPPRISQLKAEIVSFLNTEPGGIIYLGANDDGSSVDFNNDEERIEKYRQWEEILSNWINTAFSPRVYGLIELKPNKIPFEIKIKAGSEKPYYYTSGQGMNFQGIFYKRRKYKKKSF